MGRAYAAIVPFCRNLALAWFLVFSFAQMKVAPLLAQVTVIDDIFESGSYDLNWDFISGTGTAVINDPGNAAGGSDYYSRIEGVATGGTGLGVTFDGLSAGSTFATDFTASFDFRVENTTDRQLVFQVGSDGSVSNTNDATLNLRYQSNQWSAFNGSSWQSIPGLGTVTPGTWNSITINGNNWGSGISGNANFDISLTSHLGANTSATGLQIWHFDDPDLGGAQSLNFNDSWGNNPGWDIDNVAISATPGGAVPTEVVITPTSPVAYSGIYPHTAVTNTHNEVGIGGIIKRGNDVFFMTYGPHITAGGSDKLYSVNTTTLEHTTYLEYPGNTDANRYRDTNLGIDVIGAAYIDNTDTIRYLPVTSAGDLRGRITGTSSHLSDPNKLYYMTMEEGLYEVDFSDLNNPVITTLRTDGNHDGVGGQGKNLPGVHGKGLFTGQGRIFYTNNGQGEGFGGGLVEWDGTGDPEQQSSWTLADTTAQYTEVTSRSGPEDMDPNSTDAIWATGWDDESMFINTRDAATGTWTKFRMPQASYTHGHPNGWYTEWPRIRDVGLQDGYLMSHHGGMFLVPDTFSVSNPSGVTPVNTHHKMVVDYIEAGDQIIFAANDASTFSNGLVPKANSNLLFVDKANLENYGGKPSGFGGVWINAGLTAGQNSDAFLINGFQERVVHFEHENAGNVDFVVEVDVNGNGTWTAHTTFTVPGTDNEGYGFYIIPEALDAEWIRFRPTSDVSSVSTYLHMSNGYRETNTAQLASLSRPSSSQPRSQGFLRSMSNGDFKLEFAADILDANGNIVDTGYYQGQLNSSTFQLELVAVTDASAEADVRLDAATTQDFTIDAASVMIVDGGTTYRLPFGDSAFDSATASGWRRGEREVVTEREVMNIHGTFYELPRNFTGGGIERIRPITTHNLDIFDFASWRGMLVLSGNSLSATEDGHYVETSDGKAGLWFGNVDDLWTFGAPQGVGGPWKDTAITAGVNSDPYLMTGYDEKILQLSHDFGSSVEFTLEVDFLGTGQWEEYGTLTVDAGEVLTHVFEDGYQAHWIRVVSDTSTTATAWFVYGDAGEVVSADFNGDGVVNGADLLMWQRNLGLTGQTDNMLGDASGNGVVDSWDFSVWRAQFGSQLPVLNTVSEIPEPSSVLLVISGLLAFFGGSTSR